MELNGPTSYVEREVCEGEVWVEWVGLCLNYAAVKKQFSVWCFFLKLHCQSNIMNIFSILRFLLSVAASVGICQINHVIHRWVPKIVNSILFIQTGRQTNIYIERQPHIQTDRQRNRQTYMHAYICICIYTHRQSDIQTSRHTYTQVDTHINK